MDELKPLELGQAYGGILYPQQFGKTALEDLGSWWLILWAIRHALERDGILPTGVLTTERLEDMFTGILPTGVLTTERLEDMFTGAIACIWRLDPLPDGTPQ